MDTAVAWLIFAAGIVILTLLSLFVIFNFYRYRFEGDRTALILVFFIVGFAITLSLTVFIAQLIQPAAVINVEPLFR